MFESEESQKALQRTLLQIADELTDLNHGVRLVNKTLRRLAAEEGLLADEEETPPEEPSPSIDDAPF